MSDGGQGEQTVAGVDISPQKSRVSALYRDQSWYTFLALERLDVCLSNGTVAPERAQARVCNVVMKYNPA